MTLPPTKYLINKYFVGGLTLGSDASALPEPCEAEETVKVLDFCSPLWKRGRSKAEYFHSL